MNTTTQEDKPQPVQIAVLAPHIVARIEKRFPAPMVPKTDLEAGYLLGVQAVLKVLRDGI